MGPGRRLLLLCVALALRVIHGISSKEEDCDEADHDMLSKIYPLKTLELYHDLIVKAEAEKPECALNHTHRYEVLNQSIDYHWQKCLRMVPGCDVHQLMVCVEDRSRGEVDILLHHITDLHRCLDEKGNATEVSEADWEKQVAEIKRNLPVKRKNDEFYVAVENAKLANRTVCYDEFYPLVKVFTSEIDKVVESCKRFVPRGRCEEFEKCCNDLGQPIESVIKSKLLYICAC